MAGRDKPCVLVVLTGGGFSFETTRLLASLPDDCAFVFLRTEHGGVPGEAGLPPGPARLIPQFATKTETFIGRSAYAFVMTWRIAREVTRDGGIDAALVLGCSHAVPTFLACRLRGIATIYIESITRATQLSMTGRIVYHLRLARLFIIQWPELQKAYPHSRLGTIL